MKPKYILNTRTHCLHIENYCGCGELFNKKVFQTEEAAVAFDGSSVHMCKTCAKKREQKLQEAEK